MSLSDKVAIVTGGSSGIGAAIAILFSQEGANVVIVGRNETKLNDVYKKCAQKPLIINADVSKDNDAKRIIKETVQTFGKIDILINNAGILRYKSIEEENVVATFDEIMAVNVRAVVNLTNLAVPYLIKTKGNIVNISSAAAQTALLPPNFLSYSVSKAALDHFSKIIAADLGSKGVRVNVLSPGPVETDVFANANIEMQWDNMRKNCALDRISKPDEMAECALFLASDKAKCMTGSIMLADNGVLLKMKEGMMNI